MDFTRLSKGINYRNIRLLREISQAKWWLRSISDRWMASGLRDLLKKEEAQSSRKVRAYSNGNHSCHRSIPSYVIYFLFGIGIFEDERIPIGFPSIPLSWNHISFVLAIIWAASSAGRKSTLQVKLLHYRGLTIIIITYAEVGPCSIWIYQ